MKDGVARRRRRELRMRLIQFAVSALLVVACAVVLAGPSGAEITASGTTGSVLLWFALAIYAAGGTYQWTSPRKRSTSRAKASQSR